MAGTPPSYEVLAGLADIIRGAGHDTGGEAPFELARAIIQAGYHRGPGLDDDDIARLAGATAGVLVDKLAGPLVPSSIPASVGQDIAEAASEGQRIQTHPIYLAGSKCLVVEYRLEADGRLMIELRREDHSTFWSGVFWPGRAGG